MHSYRFQSTFVCLLIVSLAGCARTTLRINTDPVSDVKIRRQEEVIQHEVAPVNADFRLRGPRDEIIIEASPVGPYAVNYKKTIFVLDQVAFSGLPVGTDKVPWLYLELDEAEFTDLPVADPVLDPTGTWKIRWYSSRSWKDISESGGPSPSLIVDFGDDSGIKGLAISPSGGQLVYSVARFGGPREARGDLVDLTASNIQSVRINGGGIQHITNEDFRDMYPSFSSDGDRLIFSSNRRQGDGMDILATGATGRSGISDIYSNHRGAKLIRPSQSSEGTIAFAVYPNARYRSTPQIWTIGGANQYPTQVASGTDPAISPDGQHIVYIGYDGNVWTARSDGSQRTQLTFQSGEISSLLEEHGIHGTPYSFPAWTPDGRQVLFTAMEGNDNTGRPNEDIWLMRLDGSGKKQLTTNGSADRYAVMSPGMQEIYFMSNRGQRWGIWRIPTADVEADLESVGNLSR